MRRPVLIAFAVVLAACPGRRPSPDGRPVAPPVVDPPPAAADPPPGAEVPEPDPEPTAWQEKCAALLREAFAGAAGLESAFARGRTEIRRTPDGREEVAIAMFPPYDPVNFHLRVERPLRDPGNEPFDWRRHMEILEDRGFLTCSRRTAHGEAWMALDGWDGRLAEAVSSVFEGPVDRCLEAAAAGANAPAAPPAPASPAP